MNFVDINQVLPDMHIGEWRRDASPGVRGFLFQDLIAISELIDKDTQYICSEFVEDVFTVKKNGVRIIQSKYTPKSELNLKEVTRELYYQYIKLRQYGYEENIIPVLSFHTNSESKPSESVAKGYLNLPQNYTPFVGTTDEKKQVVKECIKATTKEAREDNLFACFYEPSDMKIFLNVFSLEEINENIGDLRRVLGEKLEALFDNDCYPIEDEENRKALLIAMATKIVQERYNEPNKEMDNQELLEYRKLYRKDFLEKLKNSLFVEPTYSTLIEGIIDEVYCDLREEKLSVDNEIRLNLLYDSSKKWVESNLDSYDGVIKLLNTVYTGAMNLCDLNSANDLRKMIFVCKEKIMTFYMNIWKIKLNLGQDFFEENILNDINEYIAFSFYKQKDWSNCSIIMGSIGDRPLKKIQYVQKRIRKWEQKPQKWYVRSGEIRGLGDYSIDVARISPEKLNISFISPDQFSVECLNCIKIDEGEWDICEHCEENIFSEECERRRFI